MNPPRRPSRSLGSRACIWLALLLGSGSAAGQAPVVRQERLPELGRSVASSDDTTALVLNPANLAFLPAGELRWTGTFLREDAAVPWQGHAFALALPLPFSLATGLRLDFVDPPGGSPLGAALSEQDANYGWLTWGLATRLGRAASVGATLERSFADGAIGDDLTSWSIGASFRWIDELGISLVAQHLGSPSNDVGTLGAAYTAALAVRPTGTRLIEIGLEGKHLADADIWIPRATLGVDIPHVGRLRGELQVSDLGGDDAAWLASAGLSMYLNRNDGSLELSGAGFTGDAVGGGSGVDVQTSVASRAFPEPVGVKLERYSVRLRLEETPGPREHVALLGQLWSLAREPLVDAVVLELRGDPAGSFAHAEELRDALLELRQQGKRVLCHLEDAGVTTLYTCAAADRILINPAGGVRFAGLRARYAFFGRLLESIGVRVEVVAIGAHKSAPERFTRSESTEVSRADKIDLLQQLERQITEALAAGRGMSFARVRAAAKEGPFMAEQAKQVGFVDGLAFDDEVGAALEKLLGRSTRLGVDDRRPPAPARFAPQPSIALVYVEGDMIDGRSRQIPLLGSQVVGSYTIADALKAARESTLIKAVVLRIESPGGSTTAADVIWRQVQLTAKVKPVVVSMGAFAASGGYYIAAPGTRLFANPSTLTGSIGVFYARPDASRLLDELGIDVEVYKTTERADADGLYRPLTVSERAALERALLEFYDLFLERVATGRKLTKSTVDRVAQGRVWTGEQAHEVGLVDELGGLRQALAHARRLAGLSDTAPIIELPRIDRSLLGRVLGVPGVSDAAPSLSSLLPPELRPAARELGPMLVHSREVPLMRLEYVLVPP